MSLHMVADLLIGLGISIFLLFIGTAPWYHPSLFLVLFDGTDVDPWPQLAFTPAVYLGGVFLTLTVGVNLYFVQAVAGLAVGTAILRRHERNPRDDDEIWPSRAVAKAIAVSGIVFTGVGVAATVGLVEPL